MVTSRSLKGLGMVNNGAALVNREVSCTPRIKAFHPSEEINARAFEGRAMHRLADAPGIGSFFTVQSFNPNMIDWRGFLYSFNGFWHR